MECQTQRNSVEKRLELQAAFLRRIVDLLETCTPWEYWPSDARSVLAGAISADVSNEFEARKARDLKRHVFRGNPANLPASTIEGLNDIEDRVRADLAGLVPLGIGRRIEFQRTATTAPPISA
jgi:hypothetical protein